VHDLPGLNSTSVLCDAYISWENGIAYSLMFHLGLLFELQLQEASQKGHFKVKNIMGNWKSWRGIICMAGAEDFDERIAVVTFSEDKFAKGMGWGLEFSVHNLDVVMTFAESSALCEFLTTDAVYIPRETDVETAAWKDEFVVEMGKAQVTVAIRPKRIRFGDDKVTVPMYAKRIRLGE